MDAVERAGLRLKLLKQQAQAGDITLLFEDESEALTHPYLAHVWAPRGTDLRVEAPVNPERSPFSERRTQLAASFTW